jgi:eukaryotic-like serine/threonine-protein kinase
LAASTGGTYNGLVLRPSSGDLAPGVAFGSYVVRELIGRGGMATVYRAEHLLLRKPVALKVMDRALLLSSGAHQRFVLEGRTVAAIKHPNVVDISDVGVYDGVPYLVMELLEGEDLEGYLRHRPPLDDGAAIRLALPVIAALHAAHGSGVVHRDIKPSNIFMSIGPDDPSDPTISGCPRCWILASRR